MSVPADDAAPRASARAPVPRFIVTFIALYLATFISLAGIGAYRMWPEPSVATATANAPQAGQTNQAGQADQNAQTAQAAGLSKEKSIMLLVCYLGVIGSCIHAMTSLATYVGNKTFYASWTMWYVLRPFIGGALAWVVYLVFRGGFLGQQSDAALNPFAFAALGAISGLFSKRVVDKLGELIDTMFRMSTGQGDDARADKAKPQEFRLADVRPKQLSLSSEATKLTLSGTGFVAGSIVEIGGVRLVPTAITATSMDVTVPIEAYIGKKTIDLVVRAGGPNGARSNAVAIPVA